MSLKLKVDTQMIVMGESVRHKWVKKDPEADTHSGYSTKSVID